MRREEVLPHDLEIAIINAAAICCDQRLPMPPIPARNPVPGQIRAFVVDDVEVVEEKQQAENRGVFDDRGLLRRCPRGPVLSKGSDERQ